MRRVVAYLVLGIAMIGCAFGPEDSWTPPPPDPVSACGWTFHVRPGHFSDDRRALIGVAADRWSEHTVKPLCVDDSESSTFDIRSIVFDSYEYHRIRIENQWEAFYGVHQQPGSHIGVIDGLDDTVFEYVVLHEFGHGIGLPHHDKDVAGVMNTSGRATFDFTQADIDACVRARSCLPSARPMAHIPASRCQERGFDGMCREYDLLTDLGMPQP